MFLPMLHSPPCPIVSFGGELTQAEEDDGAKVSYADGNEQSAWAGARASERADGVEGEVGGATPHVAVLHADSTSSCCDVCATGVRGECV